MSDRDELKSDVRLTSIEGRRPAETQRPNQSDLDFLRAYLEQELENSKTSGTETEGAVMTVEGYPNGWLVIGAIGDDGSGRPGNREDVIGALKGLTGVEDWARREADKTVYAAAGKGQRLFWREGASHVTQRFADRLLSDEAVEAAARRLSVILQVAISDSNMQHAMKAAIDAVTREEDGNE